MTETILYPKIKTRYVKKGITYTEFDFSNMLDNERHDKDMEDWSNRKIEVKE